MYCIVFIHFYRASYSLNLSEALPTREIDTVSEFTRRNARRNCRWRTCPRSLVPTWRLGRKVSSLPMRHHVPYPYIPLQLTKSLSIVSLHLTWTGYSHPSLYLGLKRPRLDYSRVHYGLGQFIPRSILWP